jgi:hypothetical protein
MEKVFDYSAAENQPIQPQASEPTEPELKVVKNIGKRYDNLLAERQKLLKELSRYDIRDYNIFHNRPKFDELETKYGLTEKWLAKVRQETDFLDMTDSLGIEIFKDNLKVQPKFPGFDIIFDSRDVHARNIKEDLRAGGWAGRLDRPVKIGMKSSSLNDQLGYLLNYGGLTPSVEILVHELIHKYHTMHQSQLNKYLSEAQAYFSGILSHKVGTVDIVKALIQPEKEAGLYRFEPDPAIEAMTTVSGLYALGLSGDKIGDLIKKSEETSVTEVKDKTEQKKRVNYFGLTDYFNKIKRKHRITDIQSQALADIYRLHAGNERMKAKLILYQLIEQNVKPEERMVDFEYIRTSINIPDYKINGKRFPAFNYAQQVYYPANEEYPYDSHTVRHGIVFGFFPDKDKQGVDFRLAKLEAGKNDSKLEFCDTPEKQEKLLAVLRKAAPSITFESKENALHHFRNFIHLLDAGEQKKICFEIIKSLVTSEEYDKYLERNIFYDDKVRMVVKKIEDDLESLIWQSKNNPSFKFGDIEDKKLFRALGELDYFEKLIGLFGKTKKDYFEWFCRATAELEALLPPLLSSWIGENLDLLDQALENSRGSKIDDNMLKSVGKITGAFEIINDSRILVGDSGKKLSEGFAALEKRFEKLKQEIGELTNE